MSNFMSNEDALQVLGTYAEDIKKAKGVIAVRETSPATAAHGVGEYVRYNGATYKVKSAISIGDSLILNTNIEANGLPEGTTIFTPEPSSGGSSAGIFIITATITGLDPQTQEPIIALDKTPAEVEEAYLAGMDIIVDGVYNASIKFRMSLTVRSQSGTQVDFAFGATSVYGSVIGYIEGGWGEARYLTTDDTTWTLINMSRKLLTWPQVSESLEGIGADRDIIIQYTGADTTNFKNGYFYKYDSTGGHGWSRIDVQPAPSQISAGAVTAGTLGGKVQANTTAAATLSDAQVRDIYATTTDLTAGTTALATGTIAIVYEA